MSYVSTCIADGAVGLWELAEASGATATDQTGNSNGTYAGSITYGQTGIPGGGGATSAQNTTSSTSNKVTIPAVAANEVTDTFTLEIWVKRTATQGATQRIMGGSGASGNPQFGFNSSNQLQVGKIAVSNIVASTSAITDTASFHHLVWTKSGATSHLYIDGTDVTGTVSNLTFTQNTSGWVIMEDGSNNNAPPSGVSYAMAAIYPTALSSSTVSKHYTLGSTTAPVNTVAPVASGTTTVGQVLSVTNGTWTDDNGGSFTYQWQRDAQGNGVYSNISSATSSTYTLVDADDACHIKCIVKDTDSRGNASTASNVLGTVVEPLPVNTVAPTVSGSTSVGSTLTATTGTWNNQGGTIATYSYQWTRAGSNISSATNSTYVTQVADSGQAVGCKVAATNTGGTSAATASSNTITVSSALSTIAGKTGTSGTAVMQKTKSGWTYVSQSSSAPSTTAIDQKGAGSFTKVKGH